jgi:hypothetical protein
LRDIVGGQEDAAVDFLYLADAFAAKATALETTVVHTHIADGVSAGQHVGGHVFAYHTPTGHHAVLANAAKLVDGHHTAYDGVLVYVHVPGYVHGIGYDGIFANDAVMRHVRVGHDEHIGLYHGLVAIGRAAVNGYIFAYGYVIAQLHGAILVLKLEVLWHSRYDRTGVDLAIFAKAGTIVENTVGSKPRAFAHFYIFMNSHKGFYDHVFAYSGTGVHVRKGRYLCHALGFLY